ncbi:hypothetical protein AJ87_04555 [Rhizobium yanglingense]|nr:hypothetical protein AJ87_04555 [Rhizobium yanglingense]
MDHQTLQGRAVIEIILLLQLARLVPLHLEKRRDIGRHVFVDLREEIDVMRIKRVVEVEDPFGHMRKIGFGRSAIYLGHGGVMAWAKQIAEQKKIDARFSTDGKGKG